MESNVRNRSRTMRRGVGAAACFTATGLLLGQLWGCSSSSDGTKPSTSTGGSLGTGATVGSGGAAGSGAGGSVGTGGSDAGGESGGVSGLGGTAGGTEPTMLPKVTGTCPPMSNLNGTIATFAGQDVTVWSGDPAKGPGPLLIYWYATGSSPAEVKVTIGQAQIDKFTSMGGVIAAQNKTTAKDNTTGNNIWYTGDAAIADEVVACAIENQHIDPRRIHSAGYSAGALQTVYMWYARSGYIASVLSYSGGNDVIDQAPLQDPSNVPAAIAAHGATGKDTYGTTSPFDFYNASHSWETSARKVSGFIIDCDDGGIHTDVVNRTKIAPQAVQFFLDHPFKVSPEPYASLPSGWPSYCSIVP